MFLRFDDHWWYGKSYSEWRWLQPTVTGMVVQSLNEGKTDITNYPANDINMPIRYYVRPNKNNRGGSK